MAALDDGTRDKVLYIPRIAAHTQDPDAHQVIKIIKDGLYELRIEYNTQKYL